MDRHGSPHAEADWLHPSAALALFEPAAGAVRAPVPQVRQETVTRYGFRAGEFGLLIPPGTGNEVLARPLVSPLPATPPGFLGLINLRGNLVPLYDMRVLLGATRPPEPARMALVLGKGDSSVGILIQDYPSALTALQPLAEMPPLPDALVAHISGAYVQDDRVWLDFDHDTFFAHAASGGR